ncbi:hypothetical protein [Curtobacterium sp. MCSS17_015]|uniref:hypothetical protein n=1 Tax=Curtobacterium sp. MCSS17_015 TaxID=2175666 RepID=UPI000DAACEB8|nr:hypothetical protein [Curtobacterium sp. MCSS17_015]WIB25447.1 hypothetical protein DEJ18_10295 [Curtobacterium sp. MCSS17_015]
MELLELTFDSLDVGQTRFTVELPAYFPGEEASTVVTARLLPMVPWSFFPDDRTEPSEDPAGTDLAIRQLDAYLQARLRENQAVQDHLANRGYFAS